jgi:hypothetical protein
VATRIGKASEFKATCVKLMDQVAATGDTDTVTKNGRHEAEVHAVERRNCGFFGG